MAALLAASKTSLTPILFRAEHSKYADARICLARLNPSSYLNLIYVSLIFFQWKYLSDIIEVRIKSFILSIVYITIRTEPPDPFHNPTLPKNLHDFF